MTPAGLLHSEIYGSMPAYGSPELIAVCCVLLRLLVPRHSPCALCSLTMCSLLEFALLSLQNCRFHKYFFVFTLSIICFFIQFSMYNIEREHAFNAEV